jgi:hypothetical protein
VRWTAHRGLAAATKWGLFTAEDAPDLLGGVTVLRGDGTRPPGPPRIAPCPLTAIPYHAWANREPGPMQVWIQEPPGGA